MKGLFAWIDRDASEEAEQLMLQALQVEPEFPPAIARLAEIKWGKGELDVAVKLIERAIGVEPQASWMRELACMMYLDADDRKAAGDVVAVFPNDSSAIILLAAYDGDYRTAAATPRDNGTLGFGFEVTNRAYWISVRAAALQDGSLPQSIAKLRNRIALPEGQESAVIGPDPKIGGLFTLAYWLRVHGDRPAADRLNLALRHWVDRYDTPPSLLHGVVQVLAGERDAALKSLAAETRGSHLYFWWLLERDPIWAPLRADPRFQAALATERQYATRQRAIIEQMRQRGEVPRRGAGSGQVVRLVHGVTKRREQRTPE
jgi:hypothetical protein